MYYRQPLVCQQPALLTPLLISCSAEDKHQVGHERGTHSVSQTRSIVSQPLISAHVKSAGWLKRDGPLPVDPVVPVDLALRRSGREVRHDVAQAQHLQSVEPKYQMHAYCIKVTVDCGTPIRILRSRDFNKQSVMAAKGAVWRDCMHIIIRPRCEALRAAVKHGPDNEIGGSSPHQRRSRGTAWRRHRHLQVVRVGVSQD